jgi:HAD superfamily hydrolase (TIGR01509 family)
MSILKVTPRVEGALCDLDGTLVETERVLYAAWTQLCRQSDVDFRTMSYSQIIGRPDLDCCEIVAKHFGLERDPETWLAEYMAIVEGMMDRDLELRPGVHEFLEYTDRHDIPRALVTSSKMKHARRALDKFELFDEFRVHVTADTVGLTGRKPLPDPYLLAAKLLGVEPKHCVAFEDSPAGVESALAAGCYVFGIPHQHSVQSQLYRCHTLLHDLSYFSIGRIRVQY